MKNLMIAKVVDQSASTEDLLLLQKILEDFYEKNNVNILVANYDLKIELVKFDEE